MGKSIYDGTDSPLTDDQKKYFRHLLDEAKSYQEEELLLGAKFLIDGDLHELEASLDRNLTRRFLGSPIRNIQRLFEDFSNFKCNGDTAAALLECHTYQKTSNNCHRMQ